MKKTAFVTGAEGFIGSHMVRFLAAEGWNVIGGHRLHANAVPKLKNVKFVQCDLTNGQRVESLFQEYKPTHVFHLGAQSLPTVSWADPVGTFESNIMGSLHVFEAIRHRSDGPIVVSACSSAEYGNVPVFSHSRKRRAAASSSASVWNQQSMLGPAGARVFPGLPGTGSQYSPLQYDRSGQNQ